MSERKKIHAYLNRERSHDRCMIFDFDSSVTIQADEPVDMVYHLYPKEEAHGHETESSK